jgi:NAD(P)-dependent dehydrogenase (short-subunit alcohol dehydrogenase family)
MEYVRRAVVENLAWGSLFAKEGESFTLDQVPDQTGKVALVTGGSEGIGFGCSHTLLKKNIAKLFILSLSKEIADGAIHALKTDLGQDVEKKIIWIPCDLADWKRTAEVAQEIEQQTDRLDTVILCAARGIMTQDITPYGIDRHMALNHFGHVVLTSHLLPLLKMTALASSNTIRIVTF